MKRLPRHASLEPSSDRTRAPPAALGPCAELGRFNVGLIAATSKSALGMPMASLVVPGVAGAEDSQLGQQATLGARSSRPCAQQPWSCQRALVFLAREGRRCPFADKTIGRRSSERPYHHPQSRRLQRDVQLTGPLAVGESLRGVVALIKWYGDGDGGGRGRGGDGSSRWQGRPSRPSGASIVGVPRA